MDLASGEDALPEELRPEEFVCQAFPDETLAHRMVVVLIMVACLLPVQLLLVTVFKSQPNFQLHFTVAGNPQQKAVRTARKRGINGVLQVRLPAEGRVF